jgi:hypothetical protein
MDGFFWLDLKPHRQRRLRRWSQSTPTLALSWSSWISVKGGWAPISAGLREAFFQRSRVPGEYIQKRLSVGLRKPQGTFDGSAVEIPRKWGDGILMKLHLHN